MSQRVWGVFFAIVLLSGCDPKKPELCDGNPCVEVDPNCMPEEEVCDGLDNDCNGQVDDLEPIDCTNGVGACLATGVERCVEGAWAACDAESGDPVDEICDGLDNDCDGQTDEEADSECREGVGECVANGYQRCVDGAPEACDATPGQPEDEVCDGLDNDCDGDSDEGTGSVCHEGIGACRAEGMQRCVGGELAACDATPGEPEAEQCDGLDNDCDDETDEETDFSCVQGMGMCAREGRFDCVAGVASCNAVPGMAGEEMCSGNDEDCDGRIDESFPEAGNACMSPELGICRTEGTQLCQDGQISCNARPNPPENETCNELDDDCDGDIDENFDTLTDPDHCGGCGIVCNLPNTNEGCAASACTVASCLGQWQDLDGDPTNGCECRPGEEDLPDPEGFDANCDGIDGDLSHAIFVSNTHGRANGLGSAADPIDRLQTAIEVAVNADLPIYLAQGDYVMAETLQIPSGVRIYGGFQYQPGQGWRRDRSLNSIIRGGSPVILYPDTLNSPTRLDTLKVIADDAAVGLSSVAIRVVDGGNNLTISGVTIQAGRGGAGTDGVDGPRIALEGVVGNAGEAGDEPNCNGCGGFGGVNFNNLDTQGGSGGDAGFPGAEGRAPGFVVAAGGAVGEPGADGVTGPDGTRSSAGDPNGILDEQTGLWTPYRTADGGPGTVGGGGGGGGGGAGQGSGGGGGAGTGGTIGNPGTGALGGGGSFCLQVDAGQVTVELSELTTMAGGRGGNGGSGSLGEAGSEGGMGGETAQGCNDCEPGGRGGRGGDGGCGGHAGGAAGGSSIAVLLIGNAQVVWRGEPMLGPAGSGGAGGRHMSCQTVAAPDGSDGYRLPIARCTLGDDGACVTLVEAAR